MVDVLPYFSYDELIVKEKFFLMWDVAGQTWNMIEVGAFFQNAFVFMKQERSKCLRLCLDIN